MQASVSPSRGTHGDPGSGRPASRAWDGTISMPLPGRLAKPRQAGLTMVIDKGLSLAETRALLDVGADYIDFIKLAFGTTVFFTPEDLRAKVQLARARGV